MLGGQEAHLYHSKQGGLTHRDYGGKDYLLPSLEAAMVICTPPPRKKDRGGKTNPESAGVTFPAGPLPEWEALTA